MAGIGFELKRMLAEDNGWGMTKAYVYAGIIGSGPWVLSIIGIMLVGWLGLSRQGVDTTAEFLLSVTYLIAVSLTVSGALQLLFVRFISDRIYQQQAEWVIPNLLGAMVFITTLSGILGSGIALYWFQNQPLYALLMLVNFVVLCNLWLVVVLVSGLKQYHAILLAFLTGYSLILLLAWLLHNAGTIGGLSAVLAGHSILLLALLISVLREQQGSLQIRFDFACRRWVYPSLILTGICFNLGVWIDKWIFWFNPATSDSVNGVLRASLIYDTPFFLAYLSVVPGMAAFLLKVETDFVETYRDYYSCINGNGTLQDIRHKRAVMLESVRSAFKTVFAVQSVSVLIFFWLADDIIQWLNLSPLFIYLYYLDLVAALLQILFLTTLSIVFYFNFLRQALWMCVGLVISNAGLTLLTQWLGAAFYGYGFAAALLLMTCLGMWALSGKLNRLEYLTFMLQR